MDEGRTRVVERPVAEDSWEGGALSGMVVVRDPESGELRTPSAGETLALVSGASVLFDQRTEGLEGERLADGAWKLDLQGRFQNATVLVAGADGRLEVVCAEHPGQVAGAAHRALHGRALGANGEETR